MCGIAGYLSVQPQEQGVLEAVDAYVEQVQHWDSRGQFFTAAAEAMRRILVEQARRKVSQKRGGGARRVDLDLGAGVAAPEEPPATDLLAVDEALRQLQRA